MAETQTDPEEIVVVPLSSDVPLAKISPPATPSGQMEGLPNVFDQRMDPANSAIQQSGAITESAKKTTGIAFSGGGIRSAAFCSGALRKMLQDDVPLENLSCVSGGGYTGAAFLDWKRRPENLYNKKWHKEFFEKMRKNAGYMCNWRSPWWGILDSFVFIVLLLSVVLILPCILWLPYSFPIAVAVDVLFGGILRENSTCPPSVKEGARTSFLMMELYDDCQPPARRLALFLTTILASLVFFVLSRIKQLVSYKGPLRLLSTLSGLVFIFTAFPWVAHDFLWPSRTWIKVLIFIVCLVLPFFFPIIRKYAGIFLGFYAYTYIVSWKVFKSELFGALPYSDDVFYPVLMGCAIAFIFFPFIGSLHQSAFNVYYRYRLSKAFFNSRADCRCEDVFPWCVRSVDGISHFIRGKGFRNEDDAEDKELTLQDLDGLSPTFISNITVNEWQIDSGAKCSHQLISFSSEGVKLIGNDVENGETEPPDFKGFEPKHMRLSEAMATSGAAVSFHMGSYENGPLDMVLELLNLLGIGMGDELVCDQRQHADTSTSRFKKYGVPILVEVSCFLPLIALPFVYWLGHSKDWVEYLVLVHVVVVLVLSWFAVEKTGLTKPGKWERFIRWWITHIFFVRFVRGFLNINNVGTNPPQVLRLSDGGHFENLALLPLLDKKLEKIVIFDGSCNPGGDKYAESLLIALNLAREKLHCSFVGENGRDINEDIRVNFLKMKSQQRPRHYKFHVQYYDGEDNKQGKGEILFIAPRHPSESIPLKKKIIDEEPKPWDVEHPSEGMPLKTSSEEQPRPWDAELGLDPKKWGESPELTEREADRLTLCCCHCCHYYGSSHCISDVLLGRFPHHKTANQFFTPDTFSAYHREGYAACVEADVTKFLTKQSTQDS